MYKNKSILMMAALLVGVFLITPGLASASMYDMEFTHPSGTTVGPGGTPVNNPDVDIVRVRSRVVGDDLELTMEVAGSIRESSGDEEYYYFIQLNDEPDETAFSNYVIVFLDLNEAECLKFGTDSSPDEVTVDFEIDGSELVFTIPLSAVEHLDAYYIYAWANFGYAEEDAPEAMDFAYSWTADDIDNGDDNGDDVPDNGDDNGDDTPDNGEDDDSPGFAFLALAVSITLAVLFYKKKQ